MCENPDYFYNYDYVMAKAKFSKISNNHERLRKDVYVGDANLPPKVGLPFHIVSAPQTPGAAATFTNTSKIVKIEDIDAGWIVQTKSGSKYKIERLSDKQYKQCLQ